MDWVHVIIDVPPGEAAASARFWSATLGWPLGSASPDQPAFASFEPADGSAYVHRQIGDHGPRIHLDLEVEDLDAEAARLQSLGAAVTDNRREWQVLQSPGGMPFCLVERRPRTKPAARTLGDHRNRLVQVSIDAPPDRHDAEVAFWREATQWRWQVGDSPEFTGKLYPNDGPIQLLLQRLGSDTVGDRTAAHIDLGTDDLGAEVARIAALGADRLGRGDGWQVLRDPTGLVFCVTHNSPD